MGFILVESFDNRSPKERKGIEGFCFKDISLMPVYKVDSIMHGCMKKKFTFINSCKRQEYKLTLKKVQ